MFGSWVLNEIWIIDLSSSLVGMLMSLSIQIISLTVLCFSHHACCLLYIWAKLTVVFTFTRFPFNLYTCVIGCGCGFGLEQKFWRIDGFGKKRHGSADLHTPIHPPHTTIRGTPNKSDLSEIFAIHGVISPLSPACEIQQDRLE